MTRHVLRYELGINVTPIELPVGTQIVHIGIKDSIRAVQMWALVPDAEECEKRFFQVFGTGWPIDVPWARHVGTAFAEGGTYVWHVFEVTNPNGGET
jgi:hypothetical protein